MVSDIPAGDGKMANSFLQCRTQAVSTSRHLVAGTREQAVRTSRHLVAGTRQQAVESMQMEERKAYYSHVFSLSEVTC